MKQINQGPSLSPFARKVPGKFSSIVKFEWFRSFTFIERLQILFGSGLLVAVGVATRHRPGEYQPLVIGKVSKHTTSDAHMEELIRNMVVQDKNKKEMLK